MSLTDKQVRQSSPKEKVYFLSDDDGLSLKVEPSGLKTWCYRYTEQSTGKRPRKNLGHYPEMSLKQARIERDLRKGQLHTNGAWDAEKIEADILRFSTVANEWLDFKTKNSLGDNPRCGVLSLAKKSLDNEILPKIGDIPFKEVNRLNLVSIVREIEKRGVKEPVKKACSYLSQIYDYSVAVGYTDLNIAMNLNKVLITTKIKINYPYLKNDEIGDFIQKTIAVKSHPIIKKALWLKLYSGVRGAELIKAEPKHFDLENKLWRIPPIHVKQLRRKVLLGFDIPDYVVPLSDQAVEIVRSAIEWSHGERYVFASPRKVGQHIHFNSINTLIRRMGYDQNKLSSHGLRSTMSTALNEAGIFKSEWIEAQLSHTDKNETRGTYNHAEYITQRSEMMQWWANYIDNYISEYTHLNAA
ncbi:tyrosine-type recombinase/integrase [Acinetobacter proteolyticus]|uniref:Integrase n=1 Tax=Acinetobacter proteolyticus TaxID=1776741 RepID=A0A2N0WIB2_9GAMM|nr:integrase arm-type DNA-binding domain-containing protein [Acinetobacter proteolyticus]PKF35537.1 integrase [Acinetobacter proteolyticus]